MALPSLRLLPADRRRRNAFVLALLVEALFIAMLLGLGAFQPLRKVTSALKTLTLTPPAPVAAPTPTRASHGRAGAKAPTPAPRAPKPQIVAPTPELPPGYIVLNRRDYAASDIGKLASHRGEIGSGEATGARDGNGAGNSDGPGGARLYNAEWYREPSEGELALYLPRDRRGPGWAMIVCKTAPRYHVEDCRQLGESPPGSGLASALRQAAWQFQVLPPRIDGKPIIGAWVRIRFDFSVRRDGTAEGG